MVTETALRKRTSRRSLQDLVHQLDPVDARILQWLLRYPFQRAEDLALAVGTSLATMYRHIALQQQAGLIERVVPAAMGTKACALYHLSNLGLHVIATHEGKDPASLAQWHRSDERSFLSFLPQLARLVTLHDCINGLVLHALEFLAHLGHRPEVGWHMTRNVALHFTYREKAARCTADASLVLRIRPPRESNPRAHERWYCVFLLLDSGIVDPDLMRQRLQRLLCYRECAERWSVYQHFPQVLILTAAPHRVERWQRCAQEVETALRVAPFAGAIACLPAGNDPVARDPWRLAWKSLSTNAPCRLQDVLRSLPVEAIPSDLRDHQTPSAEVPDAAQAENDASCPTRRLSKVIGGNYTERAERLKQERGNTSHNEREVIALLGVQLSRRHLDLLDLLCDHPLLSAQDMAALSDVQAGSVGRYLRELHQAGCIEALYTRAGERWRLHERGLRLVAAAHRVSWRSIATPASPSSTRTGGDEIHLVRQGEDMLLRHIEHTEGIYGFFASLAQAAQQECRGQREHCLLWWETGALCERRYRDHDCWHNLRPDAEGAFQAGERCVRFWLEWDRATMGTRDLTAKFSTYAHYVASREWFREKTVLPILLVVAPDRDQEMRIVRIATHVLPPAPALVVRTTTATRLEEHGPLAAIWCQALPKAGEKETIG